MRRVRKLAGARINVPVRPRVSSLCPAGRRREESEYDLGRQGENWPPEKPPRVCIFYPDPAPRPVPPASGR